MPSRRKPSSSATDQKQSQAEALTDLRRARADHAERKLADRRNILLGTFFADHVARNPKLRGYVEKHIFKFHTRERDQVFLRAWLDHLVERPKLSK